MINVQFSDLEEEELRVLVIESKDKNIGSAVRDLVLAIVRGKVYLSLPSKHLIKPKFDEEK